MEMISNSAKDTLDIGRRIAKHLRKQDIICLFGELGSGKTVLTKGIASGLGADKKNIISPTFVLIRQYSKTRLPLFHFDLYRLNACKEIMILGYEEYFYDEGVTVIEWADRLKYLLPKEYLKIELLIKGDKKRLLKFCAFGSRYKELLRRFQ
jgi:tRNA threonylcarbamoyladenosine biosynthesis protein TsaE